MAENTDIMIQVEAEISKAIQNINELEKSLKTTQTTINDQINPSTETMGGKLQKVGGKISGLGNKIKSALGTEAALAFAAAGTAALNFSKQCVSAAIKSESEWTRFGALVNSNGGNWANEQKAIRSWASDHANAMGYAVSDTRQASMALMQYGVKSNELKTAMNGVAGVAARTGMTEVEASQMVISALNGRGMQLAKMTGLRIEDYKNADGQIDRERLLNDLYNQNKDAIAAHGKTTEAAVQRMNNAWGSFKKDIGDALLPVVGMLADVAAAIAKAFKNSPGWFKGFIAVLLVVGGAIGAVIGVLGLIAPALVSLGGMITAIGGAGSIMGALAPVTAGLGVIFGGLGAAIASALLPIIAIIAAFALLYVVGAKMGWWKDLSGMISKFGEVLGQVVGVISDFVSWFVKLFTDFPAAQAQFKEFVGFLGGALVSALGSAWDGIKGAGEGLLQAIGDMFKGAITGAISAAQDFCSNIVDTITTGLTNLGASVVPGGGLTEGILAIFAPIPTLLYGLFQRIGPMVVPAIQQFISDVVNGFSQLGGRIIGSVEQFVSNVVTGFSKLSGQAAGFVTDFINAIVTGFSQLGGQISGLVMQAITFIGTTIWNGLLSYLAFCGQIRTMLIQIVMNFIMQIPLYIQLIANAILVRFNMLIAQVSMIWSMIFMAIRMKLMQIWTVAGQLAGMVLNVIITRWNALVARVRGIFQNVVNTVRSRLASAVGAAKSKAAEIYNGIKNKVAEIPQAVADEFNKIKEKISNALDNAKNIAVSKISELVAAVKGALGIASPGYIQRMMTYEFSAIPEIIVDNSTLAISNASKMATGIVRAWNDNMDTLSVDIDENRANILDRITIPPIINSDALSTTTYGNMNDALRISSQADILNRPTRPGQTQNNENNNNTHKTLVINEVKLDCHNLTEAEWKRGLWTAIQGVYEGL